MNPLKQTDSVDKAVTDYSKQDTRYIASGQEKCTPEAQYVHDPPNFSVFPRPSPFLSS